MKNLLLAATALVAIATSAYAHSATIPDVMIGGWCAKDSVDIYVYQRIGFDKDQVESCSSEYLLAKPHEFRANEATCTPIIVQRIFQGNYLIRANCKGMMDHWTADFWFDWEDTEHSLRFVPMNVSKRWPINFMVVNWYVLDGHCGHGIDQSEKEFKACDNARHSVTLVLNSHGYCYGKYDQGHAEMEWHK